MKKSKELIKIHVTLRNELLKTLREQTTVSNGQIELISPIKCKINNGEKSGVLVNVSKIKMVNDNPVFLSEFSAPFNVSDFGTTDILNVISESERTMAYNNI